MGWFGKSKEEEIEEEFYNAQREFDKRIAEGEHLAGWLEIAIRKSWGPTTAIQMIKETGRKVNPEDISYAKNRQIYVDFTSLAFYDNLQDLDMSYEDTEMMLHMNSILLGEIVKYEEDILRVNRKRGMEGFLGMNLPMTGIAIRANMVAASMWLDVLDGKPIAEVMDMVLRPYMNNK